MSGAGTRPDDPTIRRAVALRYDALDAPTPKLVAKGTGELADQIIALAQEHGIPVHEDRNVVALLSQLELDAEIPEELYRAVAAILAFVYRLSERDESSRS